MIYGRVCTDCVGDAVVDELHMMHGCSGLEPFLAAACFVSTKRDTRMSFFAAGSHASFELCSGMT